MKKRNLILTSVIGAVLVITMLVLLVDQTKTTAAQRAHLAGIADLATLLIEAERANSAHDIVLERTLLERAPGLEGTPKKGAEVERRLAVLDWKYHARYDDARKRLRTATEGAEPAEAWLALARLEQAAGEFDAAATASSQALDSATTSDETRRARLAFGQALTEKSIELRLAGKPVDESLAEALTHVKELVLAEPGLLEVSRCMLQAALLLDRNNDALTAWRSYFHVAPGRSMPNAVADAGERLERLLTDKVSGDRRFELVQALSDSRLFTEAALVAYGSSETTEDPRLRKTLAYARLLRNLREITEEYYRKTSLGKGSKSDYQAQVGVEAKKFFEDAGAEDQLDRDEPLDSLREVAKSEFGAVVNFGKTAGYEDLHMGHIVVDLRRKVEQYGHRADVRFVMLDNIVSNGFQSWAWEGGGQHGGWGGSEMIVQIRPAYVDGPLIIWRKLNDEEEFREFEEEMQRESANDDARAGENPHGFLPGLSMRLKLQGTTAVVERLRSEGLEGDALRMGFVAEFERIIQESSIFAHEGRHAIDASGAMPSARTWKKEFNAKLSEVAFAPEPRLALGAIISPGIGSDTPHGRANAEIMEKVVSWMKKHRAEIDGLDPDRPMLPQFDSLTDDQMRAAFRSMDSLAG